MDYKKQRALIRSRLDNKEAVKNFLENNVGIDVTRNGFFKVREDDKTPSCKINRDGSCHDFGSGSYFKDIVSLLFDGYAAFSSLPSTMEWVCLKLDIEWERNDG